MPIAGEAHLAALILTGACNYRPVAGPDGRRYAFATYVSTELADIEPDEEQRKKRVTRVQQQQDKAVLHVLDLTTGESVTYQRDAVYTFLQPWLPLLANQVLATYQPLYRLDPEDWEIDVVMRIGQDKQLPGAPFPLSRVGFLGWQ